MGNNNIIIERRVRIFATKNKLRIRKSKNGIFLYKDAKYKPTNFQSYVSFQENPSDLKYAFEGISNELEHFNYIDKNYEQNEEDTWKKNLKILKERNRSK